MYREIQFFLKVFYLCKQYIKDLHDLSNPNRLVFYLQMAEVKLAKYIK